jgi:3-oxo-5-alpha-steroid 4-dehydrogenase 1
MLLTVCLLVLFASIPLMFAALLFLPAPYGRYPTEGWGPTVGARAGWLLMELPALAVIVVTAFIQRHGLSIGALVLLAFWQLHYVYRTLIFPFLIRERGKRFPLLLIVFAVIFNGMNGYANGVSLERVPSFLSGAWLSDLRIIAGLVIFMCGFVTHVWADGVLRGLRAPGETGYRIPRGGLFEKVACPNYLGEIVQWTGWALAAWSFAGLAFALFTAANLVPRADAHWRWYRAYFPEFPNERKRVIPFLF